jgi:16S rRNA (cytidine1402-2'-O)-methyltransferase
MGMTGRVVLVATPIGNLDELSPRAVRTLEDADVIAAEDTRRTRVLLSAAGIRARGRLVSCNRENERRVAPELAGRAARGEVVALVTDAGTPGIADPGEAVVRACVEIGAAVEVVAGPSSLTAALAVSGLPTGRFAFESFLPRHKGERDRRLRDLAAEERTIVLLEAPHRAADTLAALASAFGPERPCAVCRELTKVHEEVFRGSLGAAARHFADGARGELVIVVAGAPANAQEIGDDMIRAHVAELRRSGMSARDAAVAAAEQLAVPRNRAYKLATEETE